MRRVRGAYTLAELQSVVGQWWGCPNLRWQYRDPEGDMVTMTTEPEWVECVRLTFLQPAEACRPCGSTKKKGLLTAVKRQREAPIDEDTFVFVIVDDLDSEA